MPSARETRGATGEDAGLLLKVASLTAEPRDTRSLVTRVAGEVKTYLGADATTVYIYSDVGAFDYSVNTGVSPGFAGELDRFGHTLWLADFVSGNTPAITCWSLSEPFPSPLHKVAHSEGFRSIVSIPFEREDRLLGVVLAYSTATTSLPPERYDTLQLVAHLTSLALDNILMAERRRWEQVAQEQFLDILSHELRTPLTSIIGFAQILRRRANVLHEVDARMRDQLSLLYAQAQRLNRLLDTFLDISNIERGTFDLVREQVDLTSLLRIAIEQSRAQARSGHLTHVDIPEHAIWVSGDSKRLGNIFGHVVSNAYRYSPDDATVMITCEEMVERHGVRVSVVDSGPGIPSELRREIFKRYYPSDTRKAGGMGVGLYVSRAIVEAHGGALTLDSAPGEGTRVSIELPKA